MRAVLDNGRSLLVLSGTIALVLAGCSEPAPELPTGPVDKAATCGVVAAAQEREKAGVKGNLPAEAQERIFHYALLAGAEGAQFDMERANAVSARMPALFDQTIQGKWQTLKPACDSAYPATQEATPTLPETPLERLQLCYALTDWLRRAFGSQGASYSEEATKLSLFTAKLDSSLAPLLTKAGIKDGDALQGWRADSLSSAAKLGQPSAVMAACQARYK